MSFQTILFTEIRLQCCYCSSMTLRKMIKRDFKEFYRLRKGFYPNSHNYFHCPTCHRNMVTLKENFSPSVKITGQVFSCGYRGAFRFFRCCPIHGWKCKEVVKL